MATTIGRRAGVDTGAGLLLLGGVLGAYLCTAGGSMATTDAVVSFDLTRQMVDHGTIALSGNLIGNEAYQGTDGRYYAPFGLAQALWNIPFYVSGRGAATLLGPGRIDGEALVKASVTIGSAVAAAGCVWTVWLFGASAGAGPRAAMLGGLLAAFCSSLWPYSKFGFNVPLVALFLTSALTWSWAGLLHGRAPSLVAGGAWLGLALLTRHEMALAALPILILVASDARGRWARVGWWLLGAAPGVFVWLGYNAARFGSPFATGYERDPTPAVGSSVGAGLWGLLVSPGTSLILYSPVVVPALAALWFLRRREPRLAWTAAGLCLAFLLFYAQLGNFAGGRSYGPRYLVPLLPMLCALLAVGMRSFSAGCRRLAVGICLISAAVQLPGVVVDFSKVRLEYALRTPGRTYEAVMNEWRSCPLVLNIRAAVQTAPRVARHLTGREPMPVIARPSSGSRGEFSQQFASSFDFWWLHLYYLSVLPAWLSLAAGTTLAGVSLLLLSAAWRRSPSPRRRQEAGSPL
ncbi:MAG: glycosyltransferase family 39 protein [Acidobacteriota bacterium]